MTRYKIKIESEALQDIQNATDWYNEQLQGLGSRFQKQIISQINSLKKNPMVLPFDTTRYTACLLKNFRFH